MARTKLNAATLSTEAEASPSGLLSTRWPSWIFSLACLITVSSCGGESSSDETAGTGAAGAGATAGGTGNTSGGGAGGSVGGSGGNTCPLTPSERGLIHEITKRSQTDAKWVFAHTSSASGSRGYGSSIPTTEVYLLKSASPPPCAGVELGAPQCLPEKNYEVCEQLDCTATDALSAKTWIQPLPITVKRVNWEVVGTTTVNAFEWTTKFTTLAADQLEVRWNGSLDILLDTGLAVSDVVIGIATLNGSNVTTGTVAHEMNFSAGKVEIYFELATPELGSIVFEGTIIANIAGFQIHWLEPCASV